MLYFFCSNCFFHIPGLWISRNKNETSRFLLYNLYISFANNNPPPTLRKKKHACTANLGVLFHKFVFICSPTYVSVDSEVIRGQSHKLTAKYLFCSLIYEKCFVAQPFLYSYVILHFYKRFEFLFYLYCIFNGRLFRNCLPLT